jgi:hypothetical protein
MILEIPYLQGAELFLSGRILWPFWPENVEKSWQHCLRLIEEVLAAACDPGEWRVLLSAHVARHVISSARHFSPRVHLIYMCVHVFNFIRAR